MYQLSPGLPLPQTLVSSSPLHLILLTCTQIKHRSKGGDAPWVGFWEENKRAVNHYENKSEVMALSIMLLGSRRNNSSNQWQGKKPHVKEDFQASRYWTSLYFYFEVFLPLPRSK